MAYFKHSHNTLTISHLYVKSLSQFYNLCKESSLLCVYLANKCCTYIHIITYSKCSPSSAMASKTPSNFAPLMAAPVSALATHECPCAVSHWVPGNSAHETCGMEGVTMTILCKAHKGIIRCHEFVASTRKLKAYIRIRRDLWVIKHPRSVQIRQMVVLLVLPDASPISLIKRGGGNIALVTP